MLERTCSWNTASPALRRASTGGWDTWWGQKLGKIWLFEDASNTAASEKTPGLIQDMLERLHLSETPANPRRRSWRKLQGKRKPGLLWLFQLPQISYRYTAWTWMDEGLTSDKAVCTNNYCVLFMHMSYNRDWMLNISLVILSYALPVMGQAVSDRPICCLAGGPELWTHLLTC